MKHNHDYLVQADVEVTVLVDVLADTFGEALLCAKQRASDSVQVKDTAQCKMLSKAADRLEKSVTVVQDWGEYSFLYPVCLKMALLADGTDEKLAYSNAESQIRRAIEVDYPCLLAEIEITSISYHQVAELQRAA